MNLISTMVGLSIAGAASPMLMDMSIAPVIAQKKAQNFGLAESAAVLYVAQNQLKTDFNDLTEPVDECTRSGTGMAINISCTFGRDKLAQTVTRAWVMPPPPPPGQSNSGNQFSVPRPDGEYAFWRLCPANDPWGVNGTNQHFVEDGYICVPVPAQGGIDPDDDMSTWLWDLRGQGLG